MKAGKKIDESLPLGAIKQSDLSLKFSPDGQTIFCTLIGTPDYSLLTEPSSDDHSEVINDFCNSSSPAKDQCDVLAKLSGTAEFNFIEPPRNGKKLLVLDLDV